MNSIVWFTYFVPDLFFIFFYMSLFLFAGVLDILFVSLLFLREHKDAPAAIFLVTIIIPGILDFFLDCKTNDCLPDITINTAFGFTLSILGFNAVFHSARVFTEIFASAGKSLVKPVMCFTHPFFQMQNESFCAIKVYCLTNSALKSLPRLFILPIFILHNGLEGISAILAILQIMMNMVFFSLTIAITFPIRSTPRVFTSSVCVLLNAFSKFMATMSSCSVILIIFAAAFKNIYFYALLVPLVRCITWGWPCWNVLRSQPVPVPKFCFLIYFILFTFLFSFIYIHPFEGKGKLHYYVFYLLDFLEEIMVIYMLTDMPLYCITSFFCFRIVMIGFLSIFGLINILHKYKDERTGCKYELQNITMERVKKKRCSDEDQTNVGKEIQDVQTREHINEEDNNKKVKNHNIRI